MLTPYVTYNNQIGVRLSFVVKDEPIRHEHSLQLISYKNYNVKAHRNPSFRLKKGLGAGNEALISWKYMPEDWRELFCTRFGNPVVEHNPLEEHFSIDARAQLFYSKYPLSDGTYMSIDAIFQSTINASVVQALAKLKKARETQHKRLGNSARGLWPGLINDLNAFNEVLITKYEAVKHTLPTSERRLREDLKGFSELSYEYYIDGRQRNQNAKKVASEKNLAMLEALLRKNNNYNNEQIAEFYNTAADALGWKVIDASTVANHRKKLGLFITSGNRGETVFNNTISMQNKRSAPTVSMVYWTIDGWDAELLYQREETNSKGHKVITYHNRLTVVVVLDPVAGIKYPIGYAIGTHETPELITEALRNAANHTAELFGERHRVYQLQSDRYAIKTLSPIYEAMSAYYTPAKVKNSKAKVIEPYFNHLNRLAQKYYPSNWSGFGIKSRKENQPNEDYANKVRHSFPDELGCRQQIIQLIEMERAAKRADYLQRWDALPVEDRQVLSNWEYLYLFGKTHTHTNRIQGEGLTPTLLGETRCYDSFDSKFREYAYMDWAIKYDPDNLDNVLVINAKCDGNKKVLEIIGTHKFELHQKYIQPMALYDRKDGDTLQLSNVSRFNKELKASVMERINNTQRILEGVFTEAPQLNDTLTKMVLCDSTGQHKDMRNRDRALPQQPKELPIVNNSIEDYEIMDDDIRTKY
jgi:hypothetical protein